MTTINHGDESNLKELRCELAGILALLLMIASGAFAWLALSAHPFPIATFGLLAALLGLGTGVRRLVSTRPTLARHLSVWGLTIGLLTAMGLFPAPWVPFLGLMLILISLLLISGYGFITAGIVAASAVWLTHNGTRAYPLPGLLVTLALDTALAWIIVRMLYTALEWAWVMQQRADRLLELARDRQGELSRAFKSLDISNTLLRRTQRELVTARRRAEEARRMKEQFAANVSHELRTPLNLILGFSEVMCLSSEVYGNVEWSPTLRQDIYQIYTSSQHLLEMIDDVLDLSRLDMVGFTLHKEPTPLEPLLRDAMAIVENLFRGRPISLEVEIAQGLPTLEIDRTRFRQVLLNLLNNAALFTEEGVVRVEAKRSDGEVMISVSDTGSGISADALPHLFDEFYQVDRSLYRRHGGAGLGLAISKHFVEAHDGRIWVQSEEGIGSTFTFALPIPDEYVPFSRLQPGRPLVLSRTDVHPPILVLDPDPAAATLIDRHIEGHKVVHVEDADRLAEEVMLHHPQVVVHNVPPGQEDDHKHSLSADVPIITCSLPNQAWLAGDLAVRTCLNKPITAKRLLQEVERMENVQDVLIIDDDRGFCRLVERMLEASGRAYDVRKAYDGVEALRALRTHRPDLMLLDLIMPDMDGFQVLEEIRLEPGLASVPVMLLTATSFVEDALAQHKGQMVIRRPEGLNPADVLRCLQAVIGVLEPHYDERSVPGDMRIA